MEHDYQKGDIMDRKHTGLLISTCVLSTVSLLLAFSLIISIFIYNNKVDELNEIIQSKNEKLNSLRSDVKELSVLESDDAYDELDDDAKMLLEIISIIKKSDNRETYGAFFEKYACIVTPEGEKYHMIDGPHLSNMKKYRIMNIKAAELYGYEKCSDCFD